jgi:hypothetical protein
VKCLCISPQGDNCLEQRSDGLYVACPTEDEGSCKAVIEIKAESYTLVPGDADKTIVMTGGSQVDVDALGIGERVDVLNDSGTDILIHTAQGTDKTIGDGGAASVLRLSGTKVFIIGGY